MRTVGLAASRLVRRDLVQDRLLRHWRTMRCWTRSGAGYARRWPLAERPSRTPGRASPSCGAVGRKLAEVEDELARLETVRPESTVVPLVTNVRDRAKAHQAAAGSAGKGPGED
jgi:hypothetical protein